MTDPVDTDALRDEATWMQETLGPWLKRHGMIANSGDVQLIAAGHIIAATDIDRLRTMIENAPHEPTCAITQTGGLLKGDRYVCTCWKADAL